jgi:Membrane bound beta barrel domain (DUF5777)
MKQLLFCLLVLISSGLFAQDSLFIGPVQPIAPGKEPVRIFNTQKAINANTTEVVGKGKMQFKVGHNFGDVGGSNGGVRHGFGLDNAADVRIAFEIGLGKKLDLIVGRTRGGSIVQQLQELGFKYQLANQLENDPSHPLSVAVFANAVLVTQKASPLNNLETSFRSFSDRMSYTLQLILARKMGKVSVQLNPTLVSRGYAISYDQKTLFALGGALRLPISEDVHLIMDYFHTFRNEASKDSFKLKSNTKFYDAIGIGFEIKVGGHNFNLNFTNATELLENRFVPRTVSTWTNGQFRWGFTISRIFVMGGKKRSK